MRCALMAETTKIHDLQLQEDYIKTERIGAPNGVVGLNEVARINMENMPTDVTPLVVDATIDNKGKTQLSNSYSGTSQSLAVTEKALSDGIASIRTFITRSNVYSVALGNLTNGSNIINVMDIWPSEILYGIWVFKNGLYQNHDVDWSADILTKTIKLTTPTTINDQYTVVFDIVLNGDTFGSSGFYTKAEMDYYLNLKADKESPTLTGTPLSTTNSTPTDNSKQIATDEFVQNAFEYYIGSQRIIVSSTEPVGTFNKYDIWIRPEF